MFNKFAILLLSFIAALEIQVQPARADALEDSIQGALMSRHPTDTRDWWRGLGESGPVTAKIIEISQADGNTYHRLRLIEALGWFPESAAAVDFIKQQGQTTPDDVIRNAAVKTVGISQGAREEEFIAKYLAHPDPHTREVAAEALRRVGTPRAKERVERFLKEVKTPWLVAKLRGQPIPVGDAPVISTSSEDRISPDFSGNWTGVWIAPAADEPIARMKTQPVVLRLQTEGVSGLQGQLTFKARNGGEPRVWPLSGVTGKALKWSGRWLDQSTGQSAALLTDAELQVQGSKHFILIRVPSRSAVLYLKRDQ